MEHSSQQLAHSLLKISAIKLQPYSPFTWVRGWRSPIYTDNRVMLSYPWLRNTIKIELARLVLEHFAGAEVIASVTIGAIAPGAIVADALGLPFVYVRDKAKDHGLENTIEGDIKPGQKVVLVEDIISTGANCVQAARSVAIAGGEVMGVAALFSYEFDVARDTLEREGLCLVALTGYHAMLEAAVATRYIKPSDLAMLEQWHDDPENWTPPALSFEL